MIGKKKLTPEQEEELSLVFRQYRENIESVTEHRKKVVEKMRNGS